MRAERLTRKTNLKKHAAPPEGDVQVFDLTNQPVFSLLSLIDEDQSERAVLPADFRTDEEILRWVAAVLCDSPAARALLVAAAEQGWAAGLTTLHSGGYFLDTDRRCVLLDRYTMEAGSLGRSPYFRHALLMAFARSLRDIWHEEKAPAAATDFQPEDILMLERARAADCDTTTVLCCWELRGAGHADVWRHLIGSAEGDMAMVYTRALERNPAAQFDGSALAYAFRQWYADELRVDGSDHETLETLDGLLAESDARNPFGQRAPGAADVEALSILPDGTCYLAGLGETILHDPFFAGLNDPINQTHLFHLIYDMEVTLVNNVPFRDGSLARRIFPGAETVRTFR